MCLALIGGAPRPLDALLRERFDPDVMALLRQSRTLHATSYAGAGAAPDALKI